MSPLVRAEWHDGLPLAEAAKEEYERIQTVAAAVRAAADVRADATCEELILALEDDDDDEDENWRARRAAARRSQDLARVDASEEHDRARLEYESTCALALVRLLATEGTP